MCAWLVVQVAGCWNDWVWSQGNLLLELHVQSLILCPGRRRVSHLYIPTKYISQKYITSLEWRYTFSTWSKSATIVQSSSSSSYWCSFKALCNATTGVIVWCAFWGSDSKCEAVSGLQFSDAQVSSRAALKTDVSGMPSQANAQD